MPCPVAGSAHAVEALQSPLLQCCCAGCICSIARLQSASVLPLISSPCFCLPLFFLHQNLTQCLLPPHFVPISCKPCLFVQDSLCFFLRISLCSTASLRLLPNFYMYLELRIISFPLRLPFCLLPSVLSLHLSCVLAPLRICLVFLPVLADVCLPIVMLFACLSHPLWVWKSPKSSPVCSLILPHIHFPPLHPSLHSRSLPLEGPTRVSLLFMSPFPTPVRPPPQVSCSATGSVPNS